MTKFKATKISTGNYEYRGFQIEKVEDYDFMQGKNITIWNIFENGCCDDCCDTLKDAKHLIDCIIENRG